MFKDETSGTSLNKVAMIFANFPFLNVTVQWVHKTNACILAATKSGFQSILKECARVDSIVLLS